MLYRFVLTLLVIINTFPGFSQFIKYPKDFESPVSNQFYWHSKLWVSTTNNGLYVSEDSGQTWVKNWRLNVEGNVNRLENSGILKVNQIVPYQNQLFGCTDHGLYRSADEGKNWQLVVNYTYTTNFGTFDRAIGQLVFSPGKIMLLLQNGSVATSLDDGVTWSDPFAIAESVADSPTNQTPRQCITWSDNKWYLLTAKRLLVSIDEAQTWQALPLSTGTGIPTVVSVQGNNIVVGASSDVFKNSSFDGKKVSLYVSTNNGQTWAQSDFLFTALNGIFTPVDINLTCTNNRLYASAMNEVWFKSPGSLTWTSCRSGIPPKPEYQSGAAVQANLLLANERIYTVVVEPSLIGQTVFLYKLYSRPLAELEAAYLAAPILPAIQEQYSFTNLISWQDVSDEDSFVIERAEQTPVTFHQLGTVASGVTSFTDVQVQTGLSYYYRIRAKKGDDYSAYSLVVQSIRSNDCVQTNTIAIARRVEQPTPLVVYALSGTELIKSVDGGKRWQKIDICDADNALYADISFPTPDLGYVVARDGTNLFKTQDGGQTWRRIRSKLPSQNWEAYSVHFVNDSIGYMLAKLAATAPGFTLYKTRNGGYSFEIVQGSPQFTLDDNGLFLKQKLKPSFIGNSTIVGLAFVGSTSSKQVAISTDGGLTWQRRAIPSEATSAARFYANSATDIWLFGRFNKNKDDVFHSTDGGASWTTISLPGRVDDPYYPINIYDIRFTDTQRGMIIGGKAGDYSDPGAKPAIGYIYRTLDGGVTWNVLTTDAPIQIQLTILSMRGEQVMAFGDGGENRTDRLTLTSATMGANWERSDDLDYIVPSSIAFRTHTEAYMTGQSQLILQGYYSPYTAFSRVNYYHKSTDGGTAWQKVYLPGTEQIFEVYFLNPANGFLTTQDAVWVTSDSGQTWQRKLTPAPFLPLRNYNDNSVHIAESYRKSYFINALTWLRISTTNQVFKTTDGGDSWIQLPTPAFTDTPIFSFIDTQTGFCTGQQGSYIGQVYQTTDGGQSWNLIGQSTSPNSTITDMYFTDSVTGFVNDISIRMTRDGGKTWNSVPNTYNSTGLSKSSFTFFSKNIGYLGGWYKTLDGGETWTKLPKRQSPIWPVAIADETTAYALNTSIRHGSVPCNLVSYAGDSLLCTNASQPAVIQISAASASSPLRFQWYKLPENVPLAGQTSATLSVTASSVYAIDSYYCEATNGCGTSKSDKFIVTGEHVLYTLKNGDWTDPSVWSCLRTPASSDRVILKHEVDLLNASVANGLRLEFHTTNAKLRYKGPAKVRFNVP